MSHPIKYRMDYKAQWLKPLLQGIWDHFNINILTTIECRSWRSTDYLIFLMLITIPGLRGETESCVLRSHLVRGISHDYGNALM